MQPSALPDRAVGSETPPPAAPAPAAPARDADDARSGLGLAKDIVKLGIWVILAMLPQTMVNIVDTILVGHLPADQATTGQSALGIALPSSGRSASAPRRSSPDATASATRTPRAPRSSTPSPSPSSSAW